jgi:hypothetical protein
MRGHAELPKVIEHLNAMSGDSNTSDNSNKQSGHREVSIAIENPFLNIRARGLLLWYPLGFILCGLVFISEEIWQTGKSVATMSLQLWLYYWIHRKSKQGNIDIRLFFRRVSNTKWVQLSGLALCRGFQENGVNGHNARDNFRGKDRLWLSQKKSSTNF